MIITALLLATTVAATLTTQKVYKKVTMDPIDRDALLFSWELTKNGLPSPTHTHVEVGSECLLEWINIPKLHAAVSIEGDGKYGYTMLENGRFRSGTIQDPSVKTIPSELKAYLRRFQNNPKLLS